ARDPAVRREWNAAITTALLAAFGALERCVLGFCWPIRGEFDARHAMRHWRERGAVTALPVVVAADAPLVFRAWRPGMALARGVMDIPYPAAGAPVVPDAAVVPVNGFDAGAYRLGYGGGFFDRTLAHLERRVVTIGVGPADAQLATIGPQPHDIPMDFIVTETALYARGEAGLRTVTAAEAATELARLFAIRALPRARSGELSSPVCYANEFPGYFG
ncbi:MAG: 5-formyltetrahydrofolate cyclo-ligase, partial [Myxococcota bacterium]